MRDHLTTWLDVLGVLLITAGIAAGLQPVLGWSSLAAAGGFVIGASALASRPARKRGGVEQ